MHLRKVVRDGEQRGGIEGRRDGLAGIDRAGNDHAIERGVDGGALQVDAGALRGGLAHLDVGVCLKELDVVLGVLRLRDELGGEEFLGALEVEFGEDLLGLRGGQVRLGTCQGAFERGWVDGGEDVAGLDLRIEIDLHVRQRAGDLGTDLDQARGSEGSVGGDGLDEVGADDGLGAELDGRRALELAATRGQRSEGAQGGGGVSCFGKMALDAHGAG